MVKELVEYAIQVLDNPFAGEKRIRVLLILKLCSRRIVLSSISV